MANKLRGQVALGAHTLSYSVNALCELEDALGKPVVQIAAGLSDASNMRLATVRTLMWAALRDHHSEVDLLGAGGIITEAGIGKAMAAISEALNVAFPDKGEAGEERMEENPQKGTAG